MKKPAKIVIGVVVLFIIAVLIYVFFFEKAEAPQMIDINSSVPTDWGNYTDLLSGINLQAPTGLTIASSTTGLSLIFPNTTPYIHTHLLHELRIDINTPAIDCVVTDGGPVSTSTIVNINGINFERETWSGVGLGNLYQGIDYTVVRNRLCYRISLFIHSTNGESFYSNDPVQIQKIDALQAMDIKSLFVLFDQVASTIKFTK